MKTNSGYAAASARAPIKSPSHQGYLGYLTQKQLAQLNKFKREPDSDRESLLSGYSGKGRRLKLRLIN